MVVIRNIKAKGTEAFWQEVVIDRGEGSVSEGRDVIDEGKRLNPSLSSARIRARIPRSMLEGFLR